jgi:acyl-CoA-dependent ceramide synthase
VDWRTSGNLALGTFAAVWFVSRHIIYVRLCWTLFYDIPRFKPYGCYSGISGKLSHAAIPEVSWGDLGRPYMDASSLVCVTPFVKWAFLSVLLAFEAMSIIWFQMIVQTITRALSKGYSDDVRSDDESEVDHSNELK